MKKPPKHQREMIKIKAQREDYEIALAQAAMLLAGWMSRFEAPSCREQQEVVDATIEWMKQTEKLMQDENIRQN
jgi:hypothetical protein